MGFWFQQSYCPLCLASITWSSTNSHQCYQERRLSFDRCFMYRWAFDSSNPTANGALLALHGHQQTANNVIRHEYRLLIVVLFYRWAFDSTNPTAHGAWVAFHDHQQTANDVIRHEDEWMPSVIAGNVLFKKKTSWIIIHSSVPKEMVHGQIQMKGPIAFQVLFTRPSMK